MLVLWLLVTVTSVALVVFRIYRRYAVGRLLPYENNVRIWGRVTDLGINDETEDADGFWILLRQGEETVHVVVGEETVLPKRRIRVGQRITVDGLRTHRIVDRLYRLPCCKDVIEAFRITTRRPELRWLTPAQVITGLATVGLAPFVLPEENAFSRTRRMVQCPIGTEIFSSKPTPRGWIHWCKKPFGHRHGPWTIWSETGQILEKGHYRDGRKNGRFTEWYRSGIQRSRVGFLRDTKDGTETIWSEKGRLLKKGRYQNGKKHGHFAEWYGAGGQRSRVDFFEGKKHGPETIWNKTGAIRIQRGWWHGAPHGRVAGYDGNSRLVDEQHFFKGVPHGRFLQWRDCVERREAPVYSPANQSPDNLPCFSKRRHRRVEETFWRGVRSGPYREWNEKGELVVDGYYWGGRRVGSWTENARSERFYVYGWVVEDPELFRRSNSRVSGLLATMNRLMVENDRELARWTRATSKPGRAAPTSESSTTQCGGGCAGEGCRDAQGKQGVWVFPHEWGMDAIYHDNMPIFGCTQRDGPLEHSCFWLELHSRQRAPTWWGKDVCPPRQVLAELGLLALSRIAIIEDSRVVYRGGRCNWIGSMGAGQAGGKINVSLHLTGLDISDAQHILLRRKLARCFARALRRNPDLHGKVELSVTTTGRFHPVGQERELSPLYQCAATVLGQSLPRWAGRRRGNLRIDFSLERGGHKH